MNLITNRKVTPLEKLKVINNKEIYLKRDDLIHPLISGNKWRKLQGQPILKSHEYLVTFGGAFSNHLVAVAYFAYITGISSIGFVRTDKLDNNNPTLELCRRYRMKLVRVNRGEYKLKQQGQTATNYLSSIKSYFLIPEGGTNLHSSNGFSYLIQEIHNQLGTNPDIICTSYGTGGTSKGIFKYMNSQTQIFINPALKGISNQKIKIKVEEEINIESNRIRIIPSYKNMRYGKVDKELLQVVDQFLIDYNILLDPIYTSRLFASIKNYEFWIKTADYKSLIIYHSGGIQGWGGIFYRNPSLKKEYPRIYNAFNEYFESNLI